MKHATSVVLVAVVAAGLLASCARVRHSATIPRDHLATVPTSIPDPPSSFPANGFRMAAPGIVRVIGGIGLPRPTCRRDQITATAVTRRTTNGVLGVVRFLGSKVRDSERELVRCALPIGRGPSGLVATNGQRLKVNLITGDTTEPPGNPRPDLAFNNGDAVWGFAWLGSYCGVRASAVTIPRGGRRAPLLARLVGPQPSCDPAARPSVLIDGVAGEPWQPVEPPRPDYSRLRLSGHIEAGTTHTRLAPIRLTLRTIGSKPITLDPCPAYSGRDYATARSGGFSDPITSGYLNCTTSGLVVEPGHPLHITIRGTNLVQTPGTGAIRGSTVFVDFGIAGVPLLHLTTKVR